MDIYEKIAIGFGILIILISIGWVTDLLTGETRTLTGTLVGKEYIAPYREPGRYTGTGEDRRWRSGTYHPAEYNLVIRESTNNLFTADCGKEIFYTVEEGQEIVYYIRVGGISSLRYSLGCPENQPSISTNSW